MIQWIHNHYDSNCEKEKAELENLQKQVIEMHEKYNNKYNEFEDDIDPKEKKIIEEEIRKQKNNKKYKA